MICCGVCRIIDEHRYVNRCAHIRIYVRVLMFGKQWLKTRISAWKMIIFNSIWKGQIFQISLKIHLKHIRMIWEWRNTVQTVHFAHTLTTWNCLKTISQQWWQISVFQPKSCGTWMTGLCNITFKTRWKSETQREGKWEREAAVWQVIDRN